MKQTILPEQSALVILAEGNITKDQPFETEFAPPDAATHAVVLVETLSGSTKLSVMTQSLSGEEKEELSKYKKVRLRFIRLPANAKTLALKVTSEASAIVRVTVAFVKREAEATRKKFSCRVCKQLCRLAVSALLAHFGVPYLDADVSGDLPLVNPPNTTTGGGFPIDADSLKDILSPDKTVPVRFAQKVSVTEFCQDFLAQPDSGPGWLKELFDMVDPKLVAGVRFSLKAVEWVFDATDRIYTTTCEFVGMCKPESVNVA